ncbi:MAG: prepilin-type N-terminal cleavage/methylation domain-containing protein [Candidatus Micrarchaeia archaeon]
MVKNLNKNGFSLTELLIVIAIISILAGIAIPQLSKYYREYRFSDYASQMEYLVKQAKIYAMERTVNVGVCVQGNTLSIRNLGTNRGAGICTGTAIKSMTVTDSYVTLGGTGGSFDPRGLAIQIGNTCVSYSGKFVKMHISKAGIRKEAGTGGC